VTVREAVMEFLRSVGVDAVFGNPGSTELRMLRDWPDDLTYVLGLQESVVVATAAGYAIGTGRPAFVSLHSAGGVGHALGSVFTAYRDRVPLLILAGQQTREMLPTRPFLGADEPATFPRPYVKWSAQPSRAEDVPAALAEAYRVAMTPPRGPVFLSVPEDDWDAPAEPVPARAVHADFVGDPAGLRAVADALTGAERPALVIGAGVDQEGAQELAVALAERARAAVWIGPMSGRSGFPEDHRLFQGFLPPVRDRLAGILGAYDVVVSLGAPLFRYHVHADGPFLPAGTRLFQLDCDPSDAAWAPVGTSVLTTVRAGVAALLDLVGERDRPDPPRRPEPEPAPGGDPVRASFVVDTLRGLLPPDAVLVEEAPSHREMLHRRLPVTRPGGFVTTGSGSLGWGLPVAVGRALASRGERVVCLVGDGSTMYSVQALWTAARHRVPVTFVVLNNHGYAAVRQLGERLDVKDPPGTEIEGIDFVEVARGLGCPGHRVTGAADLERALRAALAADGPVLVEVPVAAEEPPGYVRPPGA
jgi:benzoylformate decarboxylase